MRRFVFIVFAISLLTTISCRSSDLSVSGMVTVDGGPLEAGTIHFRPISDSTTKEVGAAVHAGEFTLPKGHRLAPGKYNVSVEGFKKTGRMVADPQRGQVPESVQLRFRHTPLEIDVTEENSNNLQIALEKLA